MNFKYLSGKIWNFITLIKKTYKLRLVVFCTRHEFEAVIEFDEVIVILFSLKRKLLKTIKA